jgi:hypothetical protein
MRVYTTCGEMMNETARDLFEMGVGRKTKTMQDKDVEGDPGYITKELTNYSFCITRPLEGLDGLFLLPNQTSALLNWCNMELKERLSEGLHNPGSAWLFRRDVWEEFLSKHNGKFAYTYNERMRTQLPLVIDGLLNDPQSRQCILTIWNPVIDAGRIGNDRVPCSLYYHFILDSQSPVLNMVYAMRSCDFITHMANDVYLAISLLVYVANQADMPVGKFFMNISSLHYYKKDEKVLDEFMRSITDDTSKKPR